MSNALPTIQLLKWIAQDIQAARGATPAAPYQVFFEKPRTAPEGSPSDGPPGYNPPYCIVLPKTTKVSFSGLTASVLNPDQANEFYIYVEEPWPDDSYPIAFAKTDWANSLIAQVQTGPNYHGIGNFPLVTDVDYGDDGDPNERVWEMMMVFTLNTTASHSNSGLG